MSNTPNWIKQLNKNDVFMLVFPSINKSVLAEVIENSPVLDESTYFGIITVNYNSNNFVSQDDLLYDDYSEDSTNKNSWYGQILM